MSSSRRRTGHSSRAHRIEPANPETTSEENYVKWFTSKVLESIADPRRPQQGRSWPIGGSNCVCGTAVDDPPRASDLSGTSMGSLFDNAQALERLEAALSVEAFDLQ